MLAERRPIPVGRRGSLIVLLFLAGAAAYFALSLSLEDLVPREGGRGLLADFAGAAFRPALDYQASFVPEGAKPFWLQVANLAFSTLIFAVAAMSLAVPGGAVLAFFGASAWWRDEPATGKSAAGRFLRRLVLPALFSAARVLTVGLRSVHELLWAVMFLAAFGLTPTTGVLAIALPYAGTLAKVFGEMIDEAPDDAARAMRAAGAPPVATFLLGLVPRALPDMTAYTFYRLECAVRSSAVLGFFGFPTLGYAINASFENLLFAEVWTYLYVLLALVLVLEMWSSRLRRRLVL